MLSSGSDFYHAHVGAQRTMGLFGPLKIKSRTDNKSLKSDPGVQHDYIMTLNEWNHHYDSTSGKLIRLFKWFKRKMTRINNKNM